MLDRTCPCRAAPRRTPRPPTSTRHGVTLTDDYAWLRADNWQEVMRDPPCSIRRSAPTSRPRTPSQGGAGRHGALQETLFAEMKGRIKEDDSSVPSPDGPFAYFVRYRDGRPASVALPRAARRRARGGPARRRRARERQGLFPARRRRAHSPDHRLLAWSADDKGSEYYTCASAISRPATTSPTRSRTSSGSPSCGPRDTPPSTTCGSTPITAPRASTAIASARRRPTTRWSTRRRTAGFFVCARRRRSPAASPTISVHDHETSESG